MTVTENQFQRACKDFRSYSKEPIQVSFLNGFFYMTGSNTALNNLQKAYGLDNKQAYIENNMFILVTSFKGQFDTVEVN